MPRYYKDARSFTQTHYGRPFYPRKDWYDSKKKWEGDGNSRYLFNTHARNKYLTSMYYAEDLARIAAMGGMGPSQLSAPAVSAARQPRQNPYTLMNQLRRRQLTGRQSRKRFYGMVY